MLVLHPNSSIINNNLINFSLSRGVNPLNTLSDHQRFIRESLEVNSTEYIRLRYPEGEDSRTPGWKHRLRQKQRSTTARHLFLRKSDDLFSDLGECIRLHIKLETQSLSYDPGTREIKVNGNYIATLDLEHVGISKWTVKYDKSPLTMDVLRYFRIPVRIRKGKPVIIIPMFSDESVLGFDLVEAGELQWEDIVGYNIYDDIRTEDFQVDRDHSYHHEDDEYRDRGGKLLYLGLKDIVYYCNLNDFRPKYINCHNSSSRISKLIPPETWDEPEFKDPYLKFEYGEDLSKLNSLLFSTDDVDRVLGCTEMLFRNASRSLYYLTLLRTMFQFGTISDDVNSPSGVSYSSKLAYSDLQRQGSKQGLNLIDIRVRSNGIEITASCKPYSKVNTKFVPFDDDFQIIFGQNSGDTADEIMRQARNYMTNPRTTENPIFLKVKFTDIYSGSAGYHSGLPVPQTSRAPMMIEGPNDKYYPLILRKPINHSSNKEYKALTIYPKFMQNRTLWGALV